MVRAAEDGDEIALDVNVFLFLLLGTALHAEAAVHVPSRRPHEHVMRRIPSRRREYRATVRGVERRVIVDDKGSFDDQVG